MGVRYYVDRIFLSRSIYFRGYLPFIKISFDLRESHVEKSENVGIGPILDDRLKEKFLKP